MYMVNTVGSYETKYWYKRWIPVKQNITLTSEQRQLVIGSLLGDGTMRIGEGARNANFKTEQGLEQRAYVLWKYRILEPLVFTEPKLSYRYRENGDAYPKSWWFRTVRHPLLTEIYMRFYEREGYRTGRKRVPHDISSDLDPLALAVWIMDDGSYSQGVIDISTYCFTLAEIGVLQKGLKDRFGVEIKYHNDRDKGYRMYCNKRETLKLIEIIEPYIIPSLKYKIGFVTP